jgi:hypothetical protein
MAVSRRRPVVALAMLAALVAIGVAVALGLRARDSVIPGEGDDKPVGSLESAPRPQPPPALAAGGRSQRPTVAASGATPPVSDGAQPAIPAPPITPSLAPRPPDRAAGGVAGLVIGPDGPVADAVLRLRRGPWTDRLYSTKTPAEPDATVAVDRDGSFRRDGLAAGDWWVEVSVPGRLPRVIGLKVGDAGVGITIPLGDGAIEGKFYDRQGRAIADAVVQVSPGVGEVGGLAYLVEVRTKPDGSFRFDGLTAGTWWVVGFFGDDRYALGANRSDHALVTAGATTTIDLGTSRVEPTWRGVVRTRSGKAVRGPGSLLLIERTMSVGHSAQIDPSGRFSQQFPQGTYSVGVCYLGGAEHKPIEAGEITLDADVEKDLTLPGSRLHGTIRNVAETALPRDQRIYWTPDGKDYHAREAVTVSADGTYVVDGVPPGRYRIEGFPLALFDTRGDPPVVDIAADPAEVTLDLVARAP